MLLSEQRRIKEAARYLLAEGKPCTTQAVARYAAVGRPSALEALRELVAEGKHHMARGEGGANYWAPVGVPITPYYPAVRGWTEETAAAALVRFREERGMRPTMNYWIKRRAELVEAGFPTRNVLEGLFGSWRAAVEAAGFRALESGQGNGPRLDPTRPCPVPGCERPAGVRTTDGRCSRCSQYRRNHGEDWAPRIVRAERLAYRMEEVRGEAIQAFRDLAEELGHIPRLEDYYGRGFPHYRYYFNSWVNLVRAAFPGYQPYTRRGPARRSWRYHWTEEMALGALRDYAKRTGLRPTCRAFDADPELPGPVVYQQYFGSWNAGLRVAGLPVVPDTRGRSTVTA